METNNKWHGPSRGRNAANPNHRSEHRFDASNSPRPSFNRFVERNHENSQSSADAPAPHRKRVRIAPQAERVDTRSFRRTPQREGYRPVRSEHRPFAPKATFVDMSKPIRLNKFLANAGICSRREADDFIQAGVISVNGETVSTLGTKVLPTDSVMFHNQPVRREKKVYVLLNKPKNCVTTTDDEKERMTVLDIVKNACAERIYPVGRLDRNTTGVLLLTNDGDLAAKLTHPKFEKRKVYAATLDHDLTEEDKATLMAGIMMDEELIIPDDLEFIKAEDRHHIGLTIHSGQNRIVRRLFEKIGYKVMQLDRTSFAGLTKKNLKRGQYRFLTPKEIAMLQMGAF